MNKTGEHFTVLDIHAMSLITTNMKTQFVMIKSFNLAMRLTIKEMLVVWIHGYGIQLLFIHKNSIVYFKIWLVALFNERKLYDSSGAEWEYSRGTGLIPWLLMTCWHMEQRHQQPHYQPVISNVSAREYDNCQISDISHTKSQNLIFSRRFLWLSLCNLLKPCIKSKMKM